MADDLSLPVSGDTVNAAILTKVVNFMTYAQRSYSGGVPASPVAFQVIVDTTLTPDGIRIRNAANSAWVTIIPDITVAGGGLLPLTGGTMSGAIAMGSTKVTGLANGTAAGDAVNKGQVDARIHPHPIYIGGISATANFSLMHGPAAAFVIVSAKIISDTATAGSTGGANYTFQITNVTQANTLLSAVKTTNGAEIAVNTVYDLGANQNLTIAASDVLRLDVVKTGSPTSLTAARIILQINAQVTT